MSLKFDHALVTVPSLADACMDFASAGFTVTPGGRHEGTPTENALVILEGGSYIELFALRDPSMRADLQSRRSWRDVDALGRRFLAAFLGPYGIADVVFRAPGLERYVSMAKLRGVPVDGPYSMGRERPDGVRLAWKLALPMSRELPFLIEDVTPTERRVPSDPEMRKHANGANAVTSVEIAVGSVPEALLVWRHWLDLAPVSAGEDEVWLGVGGPRVRLYNAAGGRPGPQRLVLAGAASLPEAVTSLRIATA